METILLIESNTDILENLTEYFEMEGYHVLSTNKGKKGIELIKEHTPNLIICDVVMPELDGYGVLSEILDMIKAKEIPFIFSSSLSEQCKIDEAFRLGADDYIIKPFTLDNLLERAKNWIKSGIRRYTMPGFIIPNINQLEN